MSRSNPYQNTPSPAACRWEWKGGEGILQWYSKETKENITEKLPMTFLMLDRTASVTGYSEPRESGMYSNEVKDTLTQPLKFFRLRAPLFKLTMGPRSGGEVSLTGAGVPGCNFTLQGSTDLKNWVDLQTSASPCAFVDPEAGQYPQRFYRTILAR